MTGKVRIKVEQSQLEEKPATLKTVVIGKGVNFYKNSKVDLNDLGEIEIGKNSYILKQKDFFIKRHGLFRRFLRKVKGVFVTVNQDYILVFKLADKKALQLKPKGKAAITSRMLKTAKESRALNWGLNDLFQTHLGTRKLIMIVLIIGVIGVAYMVLTGQLKI
ncbi:MAG: hypothetical protein Q6356_003250 [Candidatus Wukongarchaeota archaeon]|nr:hypothetical protein [Candidatus Wukongarchaeota archaeon]